MVTRYNPDLYQIILQGNPDEIIQQARDIQEKRLKEILAAIEQEVEGSADIQELKNVNQMILIDPSIKTCKLCGLSYHKANKCWVNSVIRGKLPE